LRIVYFLLERITAPIFCRAGCRFCLFLPLPDLFPFSSANPVSAACSGVYLQSLRTLPSGQRTACQLCTSTISRYARDFHPLVDALPSAQKAAQDHSWHRLNYPTHECVNTFSLTNQVRRAR